MRWCKILCSFASSEKYVIQNRSRSTALVCGKKLFHKKLRIIGTEFQFRFFF